PDQSTNPIARVEHYPIAWSYLRSDLEGVDGEELMRWRAGPGSPLRGEIVSNSHYRIGRASRSLDRRLFSANSPIIFHARRRSRDRPPYLTSKMRIAGSLLFWAMVLGRWRRAAAWQTL